MSNKLVKVGDSVQLKDTPRQFSKVKKNRIYKVLKIQVSTGYYDGSSFITEMEDIEGNIIQLKMFENFFDIVHTAPETIQRPILEERKVGKVRMELFDSGFPNAVYEIAKVMTWANENKGYKDNDWKTIPDAENAFKGAAARHRVKQNMQRSFGEDLLNCADEESNITHLAHEAFNVLALLELALVGKIK